MALHPPTPTPAPLTDRTDAARRSLRAAWVFVAGLAVSFVVAIVIGEALLSLQGYPSGGETPPLDVMLLAGVPALVVLVSPAIGAIWFGMRARRLGEPRGITPVVVASVVAGGALVTNTVQAVAGLLTG